MNPNYAGPAGGSLPPTPNGTNGPPPGSLPTYGRSGSPPRTEVRPILDNRMTSPKTGYPHQQSYSHHPDSSNPGGIAGGAPPPAAALAAAEAAASDRANERPGSVGPKRLREWEEEPAVVKKAASDENRARMDDMHHRRPSTPPQQEAFRRSSSEARRAEDQRRANENYHPSEAAHMPQTHSLPAQLPPMQSTPGPAQETQLPPPAPKDYPMEDRSNEPRPESTVPPPQQAPAEPERAARKVDVDEDYDDDAEDEKKGNIVSAASGPASANGEKTSSPNAVNGHANGVSGQAAPKAEMAV